MEISRRHGRVVGPKGADLHRAVPVCGAAVPKLPVIVLPRRPHLAACEGGREGIGSLQTGASSCKVEEGCVWNGDGWWWRLSKSRLQVQAGQAGEDLLNSPSWA